MKLLFVINDSGARHLEYCATGIYNNPSMRCVTITLTPEQINEIGLRKIGTNSGRDVYETIQNVALLIDKTDE